MTMRTITISADHIAALKAIRSVVADAAGHPARDAAIEAIDALAAPVEPSVSYDSNLVEDPRAAGRYMASCQGCGTRHEIDHLDCTMWCTACRAKHGLAPIAAVAKPIDGHPTREECVQKFDELRVSGMMLPVSPMTRLATAEEQAKPMLCVCGGRLTPHVCSGPRSSAPGAYAVQEIKAAQAASVIIGTLANEPRGPTEPVEAIVPRVVVKPT